MQREQLTIGSSFSSEEKRARPNNRHLNVGHPHQRRLRCRRLVDLNLFVRVDKVAELIEIFVQDCVKVGMVGSLHILKHVGRELTHGVIVEKCTVLGQQRGWISEQRNGVGKVDKPRNEQLINQTHKEMITDRFTCQLLWMRIL